MAEKKKKKKQPNTGKVTLELIQEVNDFSCFSIQSGWVAPCVIMGSLEETLVGAGWLFSARATSFKGAVEEIIKGGLLVPLFQGNKGKC